ncbi:30S ribosome-binding factor RbfA [Legionella nagasakiensis]|uniref:30S ribosome-binding factor RbfA n=1 Tax=Legionella nagasakiensis TaxID=535290 RepID=UPI001055EAB7|nr:30S ribosome-binding factor RbfA [Legionella nagasakiensis]
MSRDFKRTDRIAETILRKLAQIIQQEVTDPRITSFITLSAVKVSKDLSHAKVYFTALNDDPNQTAMILNTAAGYLRTILAKTVKLRTVPQLQFVYDESIEYGKRLSRLIDEVNPPDSNDEQSD